MKCRARVRVPRPGLDPREKKIVEHRQVTVVLKKSKQKHRVA